MFCQLERVVKQGEEEWKQWVGASSGQSMKQKILSWNVGGANDREKQKVIQSLIRSQRVDLVC